MSKRYRTSTLEHVLASQGRTQRWVAAQAGFSAPMLSQVMSGRKTIGHDHAARIAAAINVEFEELFTPTDAPESVADAA